MRYKIQGYVLVPFEVVVDAADQDEAHQLVEDMDNVDLLPKDLPGETTVEETWVVNTSTPLTHNEHGRLTPEEIQGRGRS